MKIPRVSIVIPAYNASATLGDCLENVMIQDYPDIEVIVVDDGSTDDTAEVVKRFGEHIHYIYQPNGGLASARNTGHRSASGEFVAWLDADDLCEPDRIALQAEYLITHDSVGLVSSDFSAFNSTGLIAERYATRNYDMLAEFQLQGLYSSSEEFCPLANTLLSKDRGRIRTYRGHIYEHLVWGNFIHPPTVMFRRSLIESAGPLDPTLPNSEDWEFFIRASRFTEFAHLDIPLLKYRRHPGQLTAPKNIGNHIPIWIAVQKKTFSDDPMLQKRHRLRGSRRLGEWYSSLALCASETDRIAALRHTVKALTHGPKLRTLLQAFAHILLPRPATVELRRQLRMLRHKRESIRVYQ